MPNKLCSNTLAINIRASLVVLSKSHHAHFVSLQSYLHCSINVMHQGLCNWKPQHRCNMKKLAKACCNSYFGVKTGSTASPPQLINFMGICCQDSSPSNLHHVLLRSGIDITKTRWDTWCRNKCGDKVTTGMNRLRRPYVRDAGECDDATLCHAKVPVKGVDRQCQRHRLGETYFCDVHAEPEQRPFGDCFI